MVWLTGRSFLARHRSNPLLAAGATVCRKYLRAFDNQFNWDIATNGEAFFLERVLDEAPGMVFDVGANIGSYTLACQALPAVHQVHAFEISPLTFETLKLNCGETPKVRLNPFGLSNENGSVNIYHSPDSSVLTSLHPIDHGHSKKLLKAEVRTGDSYLAAEQIPKVSFVKIDVEGADLATLQGFAKAFADGRILAVQYEHGEPSVESRTFLRDIVRFLQAFGLTSYQIYPRSIVPVDQSGYEMEDFRGRNYLALSPLLDNKLARFRS